MKHIDETTTSTEEIKKFCTICKRTGHWAKEHDDWEKIKIG